MNTLIKLHPIDNILILAKEIRPGVLLIIDGKEIIADKIIPLGHKIAARDIKSGEQIIKYGVPVGSATTDINAGIHIHVHNMKSDYIPTFTTETDYGDNNK